MSPTPIAWRRILVHHSAGADTDKAECEAIARWHTTKDDPATPAVEGRGWRAIGYHGLVERIAGHYVFARGRPLDMVGSHCPGQNRIALGLCLVGDFTANPPPPAQLEVAADVLADWCYRFGIPTSEIRPHREFRQTECPGRAFDVALLRERVERLAAHG